MVLLPTSSAAVLNEPSIRYGHDGNGLLNESEEQLERLQPDRHGLGASGWLRPEDDLLRLQSLAVKALVGISVLADAVLVVATKSLFTVARD